MASTVEELIPRIHESLVVFWNHLRDDDARLLWRTVAAACRSFDAASVVSEGRPAVVNFEWCVTLDAPSGRVARRYPGIPEFVERGSVVHTRGVDEHLRQVRAVATFRIEVVDHEAGSISTTLA